MTGGLVVSNYGAELNGITIFESSYPVLTEKSIRAAEILMRGMTALSADDFFTYVIASQRRVAPNDVVISGKRPGSSGNHRCRIYPSRHPMSIAMKRKRPVNQ